MAISKPELACVYASLILADDDIDVTVNITLACLFSLSVCHVAFARATVLCFFTRSSTVSAVFRPARIARSCFSSPLSSLSVRASVSSAGSSRLLLCVSFRWPSTTIVATCSKTRPISWSYSFRLAFLRTVRFCIP